MKRAVCLTGALLLAACNPSVPVLDAGLPRGVRTPYVGPAQGSASPAPTAAPTPAPSVAPSPSA
ncbi:MAG: hypothetical protein JWM80_3389, partial [Cyanobacteria bacterium RYN_339]|nr:hypothetical protein [Cyanobacteria bacterium RYN_339]